MTDYTEYSKATTGEFSDGEKISAHMLAKARGDDNLQIGCHPQRKKTEGKLLFRVRNNTKHRNRWWLVQAGSNP
jgi:hypothetical protein